MPNWETWHIWVVVKRYPRTVCGAVMPCVKLHTALSIWIYLRKVKSSSTAVHMLNENKSTYWMILFLHATRGSLETELLKCGVSWDVPHHMRHMPVDLDLRHGKLGTAVAQWLRCCATNQRVAGSNPAGVSGFFIDTKSFWLHYSPGVDSASNRNEYQENFLGVKTASA